MKLLDLYKTHPYEPLIPTVVDTKQMVYKFNSPRHFFSWVQALHSGGRNGQSSQTASEEKSEEKNSFTMSKTLDHAYEVLRDTRFDPKQTDILEARISELKKGTFYAEEGYEIEIPEYLSGGEKIWIKQKVRSKPTRIIDDVLMIDSAYSAGRDADTCRKIGMEILTSIYRRNVIPRKMVVTYGEKNNRNSGGDFLCAIDVTFSDLDGIAKLLHPASFRRLFFRLSEIFPDLVYGYGFPYNGSTEKGYISIDSLYSQWGNKDYFEKEIDTFLGTEKK